MRKSRKAKRRKLRCTVAVEISRDTVKMVIVDRQEGGVRDVRGYRTRWLHDAVSLDADQGVVELTRALKSLVEQNKLAGGTVNVALSSDFCVTRVVAGEADKMVSEMSHLRERSAHYLSLGAGPKAVSECVQPIDMKNSQGWLTVTNRETLDLIIRALEEAGLHAALVEHSMVAVSRAVGRMGGDASSPVIVIELGESGVDLGISYHGKLLFDYRPGGIRSQDHIAEIVEKHLERIQRYSTRFFRFASGQIRHVYLVGDIASAELVRHQFANSSRLTAEILNPALICPEWRYEERLVADSEFLAALGCALVEPDQSSASAAEREFPNLMDVLHAHGNEPVWPGVRRHLWPVAAAAAVGVAIYAGAMLRHRQVDRMEQQLVEADAQSALANTLRLELDNLVVRGKYLKVLDLDLVNPPLHELIASVVQNKPDGVYLNKISLDADSNMVFLGVADSTDLIYDFESRLKAVALLENLAIAGMSPERLPTNENATGFQIKCKFAGGEDFAEGAKKNG
ncbi:MAG: PilN domain-containing protein [Pirellulaceae bacterium]